MNPKSSLKGAKMYIYKKGQTIARFQQKCLGIQRWFQKRGSFTQGGVCKLTVCVDVKAEVSSPRGAAVVNVYESLRSI